MEQRIRDLLAQINTLEEELAQALHEKEQRLFYQFNGRRIEFEQSIRATHKRMKRSVLRWIITDRPQNFVTGPLIYSLIIPILTLDIFVSVFQTLCFPVYGIARVKRADYVVVDRFHLGYLNFFERFHCAYCGYANGVLAYAVEIAARTEQYFCPIKHARKVLGSHTRAQRFLEYGDATDYHARLEAFRKALEQADPL